MRLEPRNSPAVRCAYCHDTLGEEPARRCARCATPLHPDCWARLEVCPIYGCDQSVAAITATSTVAARWPTGLLLVGMFLLWGLLSLLPTRRDPIRKQRASADKVRESITRQMEDEPTRLRTVVQLRSRGGEEAIQTLSEILSLDRSLSVRLEAAQALALVTGSKDGIVYSALESALRDDQVPTVRAACATSVVTRLCARPTQSIDADAYAARGAEILAKGLTDPDERVQTACVDGLIRLARRRPHPEITKALRQASQSASERNRAAAERALRLHAPADQPR